MNSFDKICSDIKSLKIQGAENIAKAGVKALLIMNDKKSISKLLNLRPTEPLLRNAINFARSNPNKLVPAALRHFHSALNKISMIGSKVVKPNSVIYTHCHSSTVVAVIKKSKNPIVYNTETRPFFQGRITAKQLSDYGIKVYHLVDSGAEVAVRKADIMLIGADAITVNGVYNKIGSSIFARLAYEYKVPVYVCSDSWKFSNKKYEKIEERDSQEVWKNPPKNVNILNPAFDVIDLKFITGIISEMGVHKDIKDFVKAVKKEYLELF